MEKIINRTIQKLKKIKEVKAVYLFGSFARGKTKPYSDIDLCVVAEEKLSKR